MLQDRLLMFGVAGLAAVATAGWMRNPVPVTANGLMPAVAQEMQAPLEVVAEPASAFSQTRVVSVAHRPSQRSYSGQTVSRARRAPVAYDDRAYEPVKQQRSKLESAAIIGGGAAAGAAIGGLAGGGKGAAIGAVGGGAAGVVYDQVTRNRNERDNVPAYRTARQTTRSTGKSAAIIGGGAAAGAAIGAAAGGGKGAAIGALGGGAAGYIYDRMTRNK